MRASRFYPLLGALALIAALLVPGMIVVCVHFDRKNRNVEEYVGSVLCKAKSLNDLPKSFVEGMRQGRYEEELALKRGVEVRKGQRLLYWSRSEVIALVLVDDTSGTAKIKQWWIRYT